jgi:hypothetical protein
MPESKPSPRFQITTGPDGTGKLVVGDHDLSHYVHGTDIEINAEAQSGARITLHLNAHALSADLADAAVDLDGATYRVLMDLGWSSPIQAEHDRAQLASRLKQLRELRDKTQALLGALGQVERLGTHCAAVERAEAELMPVIQQLATLPQLPPEAK